MQILIDDDLGRLTLRRLWPWHRLLARSLAAQSPLPAQGVAMVSQLLADGGGPLYRVGTHDDLDAVIERAAQALTG